MSGLFVRDWEGQEDSTTMGLVTKTLKRASEKLRNRLMDQVGGQLVSRIADTSADAPSAHFQPKRDVYRKIREEEEAAKAEARAARAAGRTPPAEGEGGGGGEGQ